MVDLPPLHTPIPIHELENEDKYVSIKLQYTTITKIFLYHSLLYRIRISVTTNHYFNHHINMISHTHSNFRSIWIKWYLLVPFIHLVNFVTETTKNIFVCGRNHIGESGHCNIHFEHCLCLALTEPSLSTHFTEPLSWLNHESLSWSRLGLTAMQLVVLSVGFRSPRELGKFYLCLECFYCKLGIWAIWMMALMGPLLK